MLIDEQLITEAVNANSTTPVQLKQCISVLSGEYVVVINVSAFGSFCGHLTEAIGWLWSSGLRLLFVFLMFWTFFSIVGGIHYTVWYPRYDLEDVHIRNLNATPSRELNHDMDILIKARHFSPVRRIEQYSYEVRTLYAEKLIGASIVPGFRPIDNQTMEVSTTQRVSLLPLGDKLGELARSDWNATGRVALRVDIQGQV